MDCVADGPVRRGWLQSCAEWRYMGEVWEGWYLVFFRLYTIVSIVSKISTQLKQ